MRNVSKSVRGRMEWRASHKVIIEAGKGRYFQAWEPLRMLIVDMTEELVDQIRETMDERADDPKQVSSDGF